MVILELEIPDLTRGNANGVVELKDFSRNELTHDFGMLLFHLFVQGLQASSLGLHGTNYYFTVVSMGTILACVLRQ